MSRPARLSVICVLLFAGSALPQCAPFKRIQSDARRLREEVHQRVPDIDPSEFVVPFEVDPQYVQTAREVASFSRSVRDKAEVLIDSLSNEHIFGVVYDDWETLTANAALEVKRGNCFAFASILVGLARSMNMRAVYAEFSSHLDEVHRMDQILVRTGHVTAMIPLGNGQYTAMEFGAPVIYGRWRILSDLEASAHYYNNRGMERIVKAKERNEALPWDEAHRDVRIATELVPTFYRAWNNLGVITARLGNKTKAIVHYRRAIELEPSSAAAYTNLGALLTDLGRIEEATPMLVRAAELDGKNADVFHLLGKVRWKTGSAPLAIDALERALELDENHQDARRLLATIQKATADEAEPARDH